MKNVKGFTLVELSIVLVIIGLIVGGIVGGQSLIHTSKLNSVITDIAKYKTAIRTFELQFDALPGDFSEGFAYWGQDCTFSADRCDGDEDGNVTWNWETEGVWKHLQLAEIITTIPSAYYNSTIPTSYPNSKIDGGLYMLNSWSAGTNTLSFGTALASYPTLPVLASKDAKMIDKKIDDGEAGSGGVTTSNEGFNNTGCVDKTVTPITYTLSNTDILCVMYFDYN